MDIKQQLQNRNQFKIKNFIDYSNFNNLIITTPSDLGVIRNGGRRGSVYGPKAIINNFLNLTIDNNNKKNFNIVNCEQTYQTNFKNAQIDESNQISHFFNKTTDNIIQLGGGHDHIYPLITSLFKTFDKIHVINIDAHLDTRTDSIHHSGTPFRQIFNDANKHKKSFFLSQIGIHAYCNQEDNFSNFDNRMQIIKMKDQRLSKKLIKQDYLTILSLDVDGLDSSFMEATSAVNHNGISKNDMNTLLDIYNSINQKLKVFGIYEYNPIYENLSNRGAKFISSLMYKFLSL